MKKYDINKDGVVSYPEFIALGRNISSDLANH